MGALDNVPEDKAFILGEKRLFNLFSLLVELRKMGDEQYSHYASEKYNYFSDWIQKVVGHKELADAMRTVKTREAAIAVLDKAIFHTKPHKAEAVVKEAARPSQKEDTIEEVDELMRKISRSEDEIKNILWKHFAKDLAREFMYGMLAGTLIGFILSKILLR